jgi:ribosome-associated toxin RatA of RatAB toxin-antitoxin module
MFSFSDSVDINAPVERVYEILVDFKKYRSFNPPELRKVKIISISETRAEVNYSVGNSLITTDYTLDYKLIPNRSLRWKLIEGSVIIKNSGTWELTSLDNKITRAALKCRVDCSFFVPSSIIFGPLSEGTPKMLIKLQKIAEKSME